MDHAAVQRQERIRCGARQANRHCLRNESTNSFCLRSYTTGVQSDSFNTCAARRKEQRRRTGSIRETL